MAYRIGLMGCGTVAGYGHIPAIKQTRGLELVSLYDLNASNLQALKDRYHVPQAFTNSAEFFDSGIDAVVITSPPQAHAVNVLEAARYGKQILCEKPLAATVDDCRKMIEATRRAGVMLFTGYDYRFSPVSQKIRELLAQEAIGAARILRLVYIWNAHGKWLIDANGQRQPNPRREAGMREGGPLVACGVHQIDLARWWLGSEVVSWSASGGWVDEFEAPDHAYLHLEHACGAHTCVEMGYSFCYTAAEPISLFSYHLVGTAGVIRFEREAKLFEMRTARGTETFPFASEKNFDGMYTAFARALQTGESGDLASPEDGLITLQLALEGAESVSQQRRERSKLIPT